MARPRPRLPPVTMTLRTGTHQLPGGGELQLPNEAQAGRDLVGGQDAPARFQKIVLDVLGLRRVERRAHRVLENHFGDHDGAGDRTALRADQRHAYPWIGVQDTLDFLRIYLHAADVDDAAFAPTEVKAAVLEFDQVAGIDESIVACQPESRRAEVPRGSSVRSNAQRALLYLHLDAITRRIEVLGREPGAAVVHV